MIIATWTPGHRHSPLLCRNTKLQEALTLYDYLVSQCNCFVFDYGNFESLYGHFVSLCRHFEVLLHLFVVTFKQQMLTATSYRCSGPPTPLVPWACVW